VAAEGSTSGTKATERSVVRFVLDGDVIEERDATPVTTVLEYLRDKLGRTGTKEGCAEGDCGACTVVLGELRPDASGVDYRAVNSCIRYLPTIDGHELITVESLQSQDGSLHPVQQSLVDHHASQCGFCTPGFVMSLFALYLSNEAPQKSQVVDALAGNLCRCTGYRPIIDAGCAQSTYREPTRWSRSDSQSRQRVTALKAVERHDSLSLPGFTAPRSLHELANALADEPHSLLLAGGTDIGLWTTKQLRELPPLIFIGAVPELKHITVTAEAIRIGAAVTLSDAWPVIVKHYPQLADVARRFASPPVCNSGTLCGNVANGSPIGDSMPALMVLGARIQLRSGPNTRDLALEDFYLGYQRKDLHAGEFITDISIPLRQDHYRLACYKVSKRFEQDIAAVCGAFLVVLSENRIVEARIAFGGVAATPVRAPRTEAALANQPWNSTTIDTAAAVLAQEFDPLTDMRSSADYRRTIAANLLRRFFAESTDALTAVREPGTGALQ
jgi:xanthine dehydrogenase small subunit